VLHLAVQRKYKLLRGATLLSQTTGCSLDWIGNVAYLQQLNINLFLTEREGRTGEYWPEVVAVRTECSEVRTKTTEGQYSPVRSRASEVSKWFIIWHHFSYGKTLPVVHSSQFPARCQGKKPLMLTGFRISLMIVAVDRQKLAWLLNEKCPASIICVSFSSSSTRQGSFIWRYFFVRGGDNSGKRRIMKRPR